MTTISDLSSSALRNVLTGVPKINFYEGGPRCPEDVPFPSTMRAVMEYLGDDVGCFEVKTKSCDCRFGCTYSFFMGVSGAAFYFSWGEGWQSDNVALHYMASDPDAPYKRAFEAAGYRYRVLDKRSPESSEGLFRQRIVESIDRGLPALAFGVIGPPEPCIITGYDEAGEVLTGWSFFQGFPEFNAGVVYEPDGAFRKKDWFADIEALMTFDQKVGRPDFKDNLRHSLEWALQVMRTPQAWPERANGIAAYDAWAEHLLRDDEFTSADYAGLWQRFSVHDDAVGTVAEERWYGSIYLAQAARQASSAAAPELLSAASCFAKEHDLMWKVWGEVGGIGRSPEKSQQLADAQVRRRIVKWIQQARDQEIEAAGHLERALATFPDRPAQPANS